MVHFIFRFVFAFPVDLYRIVIISRAVITQDIKLENGDIKPYTYQDITSLQRYQRPDVSIKIEISKAYRRSRGLSNLFHDIIHKV